MLELAILGLLKEQALHGYELKKRLGEALGPFSGASFGSLYPALRRLETAGAIVSVDPEPDGEFRQRGESLASIPSLGGELATFRARARRTTTRETTGRKKKS